MTEHLYRLPKPPSDNSLRAVSNGRIISSKAYRQWKIDAGWAVQEQRKQYPDIETFPVSVRISIHDASWLTGKHPRDLGNVTKAILDLFVSHEIIPDDSVKQINDIRLLFSPGIPSYVVTFTEA